MGREWKWCRSLPGAAEPQEECSSTTTSGCMNGILHYFDFQHLLLFSGSTRRCSPDRHPSSQPPATQSDQHQGLEAPRNSLELDHERKASSDLSDIPIGIEVLPTSSSSENKNKNRKNMLMLLEEERETSSQSETPRSSNIVARLMGLEVLPDGASSSPAPPNSSKTPPPLQSIRKSSKKMIDFAGDQTRKLPAAPRQPLQSLNCNYTSGSRSTSGDPRRLSLQSNKENSNFKNRRKESSIKLQEQNRTSPKIHSPGGGDHHEAAVTKSKRTPAPEKKEICESNAQNQTTKNQSEVKKEQKKCIKASNERFTEKIKKPSSQDQKKASKNLQWSSNPKMETNSSQRLSKIQKIEQVFEQDLDPEYRYVKSILEHADPMFRLYSSSLPIDPIIFHQIELEIELDEKDDHRELLRGTMQYKWNRKLLFHLVGELLGGFLLRRSSAAAAASLWLLPRLWARIRSFPELNCRVIGDIDALVVGDLAEANTRRLLHHPAVAEEAEYVVAVVEQEILHDLLDDVTVLMIVVAMTRSINPTELQLGGKNKSQNEQENKTNPAQEFK